MKDYEYRVRDLNDRTYGPSTRYLVERRPRSILSARWVEIASCPRRNYAHGLIQSIAKADELDELRRTG